MIKLIAVGKLKEQYLVNMVEDYKKRINKYHKLEIVEINDDGIEKEGIKILEKLSKKSFKFAKFINDHLMENANIDFIIGGSNGISKEVLDNIDYELSFSDLTFPHGLFRAILLEQIYRGFKIINNETYHK